MYTIIRDTYIYSRNETDAKYVSLKWCLKSVTYDKKHLIWLYIVTKH